MSNVVETREYVDGGRTLAAHVQDNGCVSFQVKMNDESGFILQAAVSSTVLRELADLADAAKAKGDVSK